MARKETHYFRNKNIVQRAKWHQKITRPLGLWIESLSPSKVLLDGFIFAFAWFMLKVFVVNFYSLVTALPWVIMAIAIVLALLSKALRQGGK